MAGVDLTAVEGLLRKGTGRFFGEARLAQGLKKTGIRLSALGRIIRRRSVEDTLQGAGASTRGSKLRGDRRIGRVDEDGESR